MMYIGRWIILILESNRVPNRLLVVGAGPNKYSRKTNKVHQGLLCFEEGTYQLPCVWGKVIASPNIKGLGLRA